MVSVRLPQDIDIRLDHLCALTRRSKSFYVKEALAQYLEDMEDVYVTMDRVARPNRTFYSNEEVEALLNARPEHG
jgi:RHH-type transcriptional regulator, rel operon repressor / antitoxin RelB